MLNKTLCRLTPGYRTILANKSFKSTVRSVSAHSERKIDVSGTSINYVQTGAGDKAILLLPGALGSAWTDFRPQIENLPKLLPDHTIIAWDPPGYGKSIPPQRNFTVDIFERDAESANALMTALGFTKFSALGWSDGGITCMLLAATYPEMVDRLVIWGSNSYILPEELEIYESKFGFYSHNLKLLIERTGLEYGNIVRHKRRETVVSKNEGTVGKVVWCRGLCAALERLG